MLKDKRIQAIIISIIICISYFLWLSPMKPARIANLKLIDSYYVLDSKISPLPKTTDKIAIVAIDDESLRRINIQWPWPRSVIAEIINKISLEKPALISTDLVFAGKSVDPANDLALTTALKNAGNVMSAAYFGSDGKYVLPEESIALCLTEFGFINKPRDADNAIRRMRPYFLTTTGDIIDYSLFLKTAGYAMGVPAATLALTVPLLRDGTAYIDFAGNQDKFHVVPAWKIIEGYKDAYSLKDKIVMVGITSESFHDTYNTPLGIMPGMLIDANETLTYMNSSFFRYAADNMNAVIIFIFVIIAVAGALRLPLISGTVFSMALIAASYLAGLFLFTRQIITDAFGPILLITISTILLHGTRSVLLVVENIVLKKEAITDGLTGLFLYRYFELQLKREMKNAVLGRKNLALVIYDLDHFKRINDTYGHEFGNIILRSVAKSLKDHSRKSNIIARYGGEEFCIIITGMDRDHAVKYSERLRNLVGTLQFKTVKGEIVKVTMSGGIAMIADVPSDDPSGFIKAADSALYRSKNTGRDRISIYDRNADSVDRAA